MNLAYVWRRWILAWVFFTLVGIQVIESSHHHDSVALEDACAVCQFVAHHPLNKLPPVAASIVAVLFLLFIITGRQQTLRITKPRCTSYHSRAPPYRTA
jgi:hypothetical protein